MNSTFEITDEIWDRRQTVVVAESQTRQDAVLVSYLGNPELPPAAQTTEVSLLGPGGWGHLFTYNGIVPSIAAAERALVALRLHNV